MLTLNGNGSEEAAKISTLGCEMNTLYSSQLFSRRGNFPLRAQRSYLFGVVLHVLAAICSE